MKLTDKDAARLANAQVEFEAWMATGNYPECTEVALARMPDGSYKSQITFAAWQAWQGAYNTKVRELTSVVERLRGALGSMLTWFDHPKREEWLNDAAHEGACEACRAAHAVLKS